MQSCRIYAFILVRNVTIIRQINVLVISVIIIIIIDTDYFGGETSWKTKEEMERTALR
jgi:hypothetical protein